MLSDVEIVDYVHLRKIEILPFTEKNLQPASYDLTVGRVLGGEAKEDEKKDEERENETQDEKMRRKEREKEGPQAYYEIKSGGSVAILTREKLVLSADVAGHVNLQNHKAIEGMELLNPGHIDPGWGHDSDSKAVGFELTAVVRNISNKPVRLYPEEPFLTIVFHTLGTATPNPYLPKSKRFEDPVKREADLEVRARRIREFVELQERIEDQLRDKLSYKDVLESLGLLTATLGLVITFVVAFVVTTSAPTQVSINGFMVDRSVLLFALGFILTVIVITVSVWRRRRVI